MKRRLNAYQALTKTIVVATLLLLFSGRLLAQCTGAQSFTANPTPLPGNTYNPGQVVTFCYTMVGFNEIGANWIDGFDLTIGAGWVPGSLTPTTPPANCGGGGGQWMWATSVTGQFSGATWGPGYFFDLNIDGNAGNDYGDQNSSSCTWNFCFTLTAGNTPGASLAVGVQALSDGQAGSWGSSACSGTPTTLSTATVSPPAGTVFVTAGSTICSGQSVTLTAVGATAYTWSPATGLSATTGATVTATPASTTTYTVTGSGGCGSCTATTTITVNPVPTVSILPAAPSVCPGGSVALTASGATTYTWSPGLWLSSTSGATVTSTPASNINYTVTGTTAGCSATATVPVTVNSNLTVSVSPASPSICIGGTGTTLTASGGTSYTWSPATGLSATTGTAVTANPTTTTTYTVTGTNASGCTGSTTVTVTANSLPTVTVNPAIPSICAGGSIVLTGMGASTYAWSPATGLSATTGTTVTANPTTNGYYTLTGTDANGCVGSHAFTLIVTTAVTGTVTTHDPLCTGSSDGMAAVTPLTGSAPFTYLWSNGQTGATAAGLPAGNVDVTVTDMLGCTGTATGTLADPPAITSSVIPFAYPGGDNVSCPGASDGSANLTVTGGTGDYTYLWSNGQTIEDANNLAAGNYTVTITDDNNCTATDNIPLLRRRV